MMSSKKGFIAHPATWILIALIIGIVVTVIVARGNLFNLAGMVCPIK